MILQFKEYKRKLKEDREANGFSREFPVPFMDYIHSFLIVLRRVELFQNMGGVFRLLYYYNRIKLKRLSIITGIDIPAGVFDGGLTLYHCGSIIVNGTAKCGKYVTLQSDINISSNVKLGDNVYIAPGAKVLDNVEVAEGVIIGANAVVTKNIDQPYTTWVGIPARKIKDVGYKNRNN